MIIKNVSNVYYCTNGFCVLDLEILLHFICLEVLLRQYRTLLIEKISSANLVDLLDDLLDVNVLSDSEKDFILESKSVKRDEVRTLIDMVKNKGEEAAKHFFNSLKKVNEALYKQMDTKSTQGPAGELISVTFCKFNLHIVSMRQ